MKNTLCKSIFVMLALVTVFGVSRAYAVPTIDGAFGVGEWNGFVAQGFDPNEAAIPDAYDLSEMRVIFENSGGASDGVYVLLQTYAAPSLVDTGVGDPPASVGFLLDSNGDADFLDAVDFQTIHKLTGFTVKDGTGATILTGVEGTNFKLGSVIEYFIPESVLSGWPYSSFSSFALYDNGGDAPDDRLPNSGFTTPVPEPGTFFLLTGGLLVGLIGFGRRFKLVF